MSKTGSSRGLKRQGRTNSVPSGDDVTEPPQAIGSSEHPMFEVSLSSLCTLIVCQRDEQTSASDQLRIVPTICSVTALTCRFVANSACVGFTRELFR